MSHPVKEVPMKCTSPLILVQFLKNSTLEALTAMVLLKAPTPMPSQAGEEKTVRLVVEDLLALLSLKQGFGIQHQLT